MKGISKTAIEIIIGKLNVQRVQKLRSAHSSDPPEASGSEQRSILKKGTGARGEGTCAIGLIRLDSRPRTLAPNATVAFSWSSSL